MKIIIFTLCIILILPISVYANYIWVQTPNTKINYVMEIDEVKGNDLYVDILFDFFIPQNISKTVDKIELAFKPDFHGKHNEPEIYNFTLCDGDYTGLDYSFGSINLICNDYPKDVKFNKTDKYEYYKIIIPIKDITDWKYYKIRIQYKISDFTLKEGSNYILWVSSVCFPEEQCQRWDKFILLPSSTSVLEDISGNVEIKDRTNNRWVLWMKDSGSSFIRYYDSTEREIIRPLIPALIGVAFGVVITTIASIIKDYFKRKHMGRVKSKGKFKQFLKWMHRNYYVNFFIGIFSALTFAIILDMKGYNILASSSNFLVWIVYLIIFILIFFLGGMVLYIYRPK